MISTPDRFNFSTARVERAHSDRARSASRRTARLPRLPLLRARVREHRTNVGVLPSPSLFDFTTPAYYNLPMTKTVNEKRAKTVFAELVGRVFSKKDTVIVEQHGKPVVAMIDFDRYQLLTNKRERLFNVLDRVWAKNRAKSARLAYQDATQAVNFVRVR